MQYLYFAINAYGTYIFIGKIKAIWNNEDPFILNILIALILTYGTASFLHSVVKLFLVGTI